MDFYIPYTGRAVLTVSDAGFLGIPVNSASLVYDDPKYVNPIGGGIPNPFTTWQASGANQRLKRLTTITTLSNVSKTTFTMSPVEWRNIDIGVYNNYMKRFDVNAFAGSCFADGIGLSGQSWYNTFIDYANEDVHFTMTRP